MNEHRPSNFKVIIAEINGDNCEDSFVLHIMEHIPKGHTISVALQTDSISGCAQLEDIGKGPHK